MTAADRWRKYKAPYWFFGLQWSAHSFPLLSSAQLWTERFIFLSVPNQLIAADVNFECAHPPCHHPAHLTARKCFKWVFQLIYRVNLAFVWQEFWVWDCKLNVIMSLFFLFTAQIVILTMQSGEVFFSSSMSTRAPLSALKKASSSYVSVVEGSWTATVQWR